MELLDLTGRIGAPDRLLVRHWAEATLSRAGIAYQSVTGWHRWALKTP